MKIIVLSDTHLPKRKRDLPLILQSDMKEADHIIHAGDLTEEKLITDMMIHAPVSAVYGNVDQADVRNKLPAKLLLQLGGIDIGVVHGHEGKGRTTKEKAIRTFLPDLPQILIFGHSHVPLIEKFENTILFNPGSPTDKRRQTHFSYGMIKINKEAVKCELVFLDEEGNKVESI